MLPARDVARSLAWWVEVCGFTESFRDGTPPHYAGMVRDGVSLHLGEITDAGLARTVADQTVVRILVTDVEAMFEEFQRRGGAVHPNGGLQTRPWGTKEFAAIDPAGVAVTFVG